MDGSPGAEGTRAAGRSYRRKALEPAQYTRTLSKA